MPALSIAVWRENAERLPNTVPANRVNELFNQITMAFRTTGNGFRIFVCAEFFFMNANRGEDDIRWYTKKQKIETVEGLKSLSRGYRGILLVGGTICWAESRKKPFSKTEWRVYNEAPVCYNGNLLELYRKRLPGGEVMNSDALRIYRNRKGNIDRTFTARIADSDDGLPQYAEQSDTRSLDALSSHVGAKIKKGTEYEAPGVQSAYEQYADRIDFIQGTDEGSFRIPGTGFTGGVEICQEQNSATLKKTSALGPTNFHLLTSNSVSPTNGNENIADPGYFVHADTSCEPLVVHHIGGVATTVPRTDWTDLTDKLHILNLPMPANLPST
jgi:hypothetical protein